MLKYSCVNYEYIMNYENIILRHYNRRTVNSFILQDSIHLIRFTRFLCSNIINTFWPLFATVIIILKKNGWKDERSVFLDTILLFRKKYFYYWRFGIYGKSVGGKVVEIVSRYKGDIFVNATEEELEHARETPACIE